MNEPEGKRGRTKTRSPSKTASRRARPGGVKRQILMSDLFINRKIEQPTPAVVEETSPVDVEEQPPEDRKEFQGKSDWHQYDREQYKMWGKRGGRPVERRKKPTQKERNERRGEKRRGEQHYKGKKFEPSAQERLLIVQTLEADRGDYSNETEYWRSMCEKFAAGRNHNDKETRKRIKKQLISYQSRKESDEKFVADKQLGLQGGRRQGDATPQHKSSQDRIGKLSRRMKEQGAEKTGPENFFQEIYDEIQLWIKRGEAWARLGRRRYCR